MKFGDLLSIIGNEPVFTTGMLLSGQSSPGKVRLQLSRWVKAGKVIKLRNGLYTLAKPYLKEESHIFCLANHIARPSYVSLQSGLSYYGLIPENVPTVTSITTGRPAEVTSYAGAFIYRHVNKRFFTGFSLENIYRGQFAYLATAEKCLLDLVYLTPGGGSPAFLEGLRLQNMGSLKMSRLVKLVRTLKSKKLQRALANLNTIANEGGYEAL